MFTVSFSDTAPTVTYTLSLHDALPISPPPAGSRACSLPEWLRRQHLVEGPAAAAGPEVGRDELHLGGPPHRAAVDRQRVPDGRQVDRGWRREVPTSPGATALVGPVALLADAEEIGS